MLLSNKEAKILETMSDYGFRELYGLQIVKLAGGMLKRGTIYTTLQRMEVKGFVESHQEEKPDDVSGIPRRLYKITAKGQRALQAYELMNFDSVTTGGATS